MRDLVSAAVGIGLAIAGGRDTARAQSDPNVSTYHNSPSRSGMFTMPGLTWKAAATMHLDPAFNAPIPGENVYAEPLYYLPPGAAHGLVIVATMSDTVRAFDAASGAQVWANTTLGTPVPNIDLPCGGQNPWGINGTPVIDEVAGNIYLNAEVLIGNVPKQKIFGLSLKDGSILPGWPVDVETALAGIGDTFSSPIQDQRGGLALVNGNLYVSYGGHGGDCGDYHGWVVGLSGLNTPSPGVFGAWVTTSIDASSSKGGIWSPGGVTYDGISLYATTGNTAKGTKVWSGGESVVRLDPTLLTLQDHFTPSDWQTLDQRDLDLGATGPLPIDVVYKTQTEHWLIQIGKDGNAYLSDRANLGGFGGNLATQLASTVTVRTAPVAYRANHRQFVAFSIGTAGNTCANPPVTNVALEALAISVAPTPAVSIAWCQSLVSTGTPIVTTTDGNQAAPIVWLAGVQGDGLLHGYAGDDGHVVFTGTNKMGRLARFSTILAAEGHLYIAGSNQLYAFTFTP